MKKKLIFALIVALLLTPWQMAFAFGANNVTLVPKTVQIEAASPSAAPHWHAFGRAIGGVDRPGDLFYIDATQNPTPIRLTLYLTNTQELRHCYSYLILKVRVYVEGNAGEWEKASWQGELIPDAFITLHNSQVGFALANNANYKVTIDGGSFYCITVSADEGSISPQFHLTAEQA